MLATPRKSQKPFQFSTLGLLWLPAKSQTTCTFSLFSFNPQFLPLKGPKNHCTALELNPLTTVYVFMMLGLTGRVVTVCVVKMLQSFYTGARGGPGASRGWDNGTFTDPRLTCVCMCVVGEDVASWPNLMVCFNNDWGTAGAMGCEVFLWLSGLWRGPGDNWTTENFRKLNLHQMAKKFRTCSWIKNKMD